MIETIKTGAEYFAMNWLDALWIPISLIVVRRGKKLKTLIFVILCMVALRLQIETVQLTGYTNGFTGLWHTPLIFRGYGIYGFFTFIFLILGYFSPRSNGAIYFAAALSIFFIAFIVSSIALII